MKRTSVKRRRSCWILTGNLYPWWWRRRDTRLYFDCGPQTLGSRYNAHHGDAEAPPPCLPPRPPRNLIGSHLYIHCPAHVNLLNRHQRTKVWQFTTVMRFKYNPATFVYHHHLKLLFLVLWLSYQRVSTLLNSPPSQLCFMPLRWCNGVLTLKNSWDYNKIEYECFCFLAVFRQQ